MKQNTKLLHGYTVLDQYTGAASIPIYQTSTFHNTELYCDEQKYLYTRFSNPTIDALEDGLRCIENAKYALSEAVRPTKAAALALRARLWVYAASPLFNGGYTCW